VSTPTPYSGRTLLATAPRLAYVPTEHERRRAARRSYTWGWTLYFLAWSAAFAGLALWLLSRHYVNDAALWGWSTVIASLDAPQGGFNRFVLLYPQVQYYLITMASLIPGLKSPQVPYLLSAIAAAGLLTHFTARLRRASIPWPMTAAIILLTAANPVFLWGATNGGGEMLGITLYYMLGLSMIVLRYSHSLHSHIMLGAVLLLFFITDARSLYLSICLLPLLPLVVQRHIMQINPVAPVLVLYSPLVFMIGIWLAMNWIYTGDSLAFLKDPASPFLGARISGDYLPWRAEFGNNFIAATAISAALLAICYPVLLLVLMKPMRRTRAYAAGLGLAGMPVFASGLATWAEFTQSPADILVLVMGGVMALMTTGIMVRDRPAAVLALMVAGMIGSLALFQKYPGVGMAGWFDAFAGRTAEAPRQTDLDLGLWLRDLDGVMIDENTAYAVIAARGGAKGLVLTFSDRFKEGVNSGKPNTNWIAMPSPQRDPHLVDLVNRYFPKAYNVGLPGYTLIYDRGGWRVYASEEQWRRLHEKRRDDDA
jgi:membrane protein XagC